MISSRALSQPASHKVSHAVFILGGVAETVCITMCCLDSLNPSPGDKGPFLQWKLKSTLGLTNISFNGKSKVVFNPSKVFCLGSVITNSSSAVQCLKVFMGLGNLGTLFQFVTFVN